MMEGEVEADGGGPSVELQPKRTTSFAKRFKNNKKPGPPVETNNLAARIAAEREKTKYWARILLLFPLVPVCVALTTIVFGGVIINVAADQCNSDLLAFMQGAVILSHVLVWFYTYCWMGPWPIKRLRTVRILYFVYGFVCFIWWGIYGTLQAATATSSGFQSCLSTSPALYLMSQYEVAVFWILLIIFIGFVVMEKTAKARAAKLAERRDKKRQALLSKRQAEEEKKGEILKEAEEEARKLEADQKKKLEDEQDRLFRDSENEDVDPAKPSNQMDNDAFDADLDNLDNLLEDPEFGGDENALPDDDDDEEEVVILANDKKGD